MDIDSVNPSPTDSSATRCGFRQSLDPRPPRCFLGQQPSRSRSVLCGTGVGAAFVDFTKEEHVMYQDDIHDAATAAQSATQAIDAASRRRAAAVSAAQNMIDNATAAERAEQDAARAALAASIRRLLSQNVRVSEIARICQMSVGMVQASAVPS